MPDITVIIRVHRRDDCYSSQFGFPRTSRNGWTDRMRDVTAGMEYFVLRAHARTHGYARACTRQRRTTLVVDLQDKYYSEKLDYRYRPPPNANSCASADPPDVPIHVHVRGCGRVWKTFSRLSPPRIFPSPPTFNLSLFSSARQTAIPHEFFFRYISTMRNDVARYGECRQTIGSRNPRLPVTRDNIADRSLRVVQRLRAQTFAEGITKMSSDIIIYHNYLFSYEFCWRKFFHNNRLSGKCRKKCFSHQFLRA